MKLRNAAIFFLLLALLLPACSQQPDEEIDPMREQLQKRCGEIASVCSETYRRADKTGTTLSQSTIDEMEAALYDAGLDVIDTSGEYPAYLMTADRFQDFWQNVQSGKRRSRRPLPSGKPARLPISCLPMGTVTPVFTAWITRWAAARKCIMRSRKFWNGI